MGYADQIGSANNVPAEHAWRYRDYVIQALRDDKPFDVFVREQLAGDLLTARSIEERQAQLTATGFLVLGNVNIVESDKLVMEMDLVDQQIEKVGKTFLGTDAQLAPDVTITSSIRLRWATTTDWPESSPAPSRPTRNSAASGAR